MTNQRAVIHCISEVLKYELDIGRRRFWNEFLDSVEEIIKARRRVILSFVIQGYRSPCSVSSKGGDGTATIPIGSTLIPFLNNGIASLTISS